MIANSGHDENGKISGGRAGDQTGQEWQVQSWYNRPWTVVLRFLDPDVANLIASLAEEAAGNDKIGYDQNERMTFWQQLEKSGYHPAWITKACEADCSAGVLAIVKASGFLLGDEKLRKIDQTGYTGTMRKILTAAGAITLDGSQFLTSDQLLARGDILLNEGHHTAINLSTGESITLRITTEQLRAAEDQVNELVKHGGYKYGDSHALPPCADRVTSCDRGAVAWPLWMLGFTDQPAGGITVLNMESYLRKHGFTKNVDVSRVTGGDIVLMRALNQSTPTAKWHTYFVLSRIGSTVTKYDYGSQNRIDAGGKSTELINAWGDKTFYCSFKLPDDHPSYFFTPNEVKRNAKISDAYVATEILKARGFKGVKNDAGEVQDLELNFDWTKGDMTALADYKADRARNGYIDLIVEDISPGTVSIRTWKDLLGTALPFECCELPARQTKGLSVLLWQEILRSRGIKGGNGKLIALDQTWGTETEIGTLKFQKAVGLPATGIVDKATWMNALGRSE